MKLCIRLWFLPFLFALVAGICSYACGAEIKGNAEAADLQSEEQETPPGMDEGPSIFGAAPARTGPAPGPHIVLPEAISPEDLAGNLAGLPGGLDVVDIRPAWQFDEYHIPGAVNVQIQELMADTAFMTNNRALVIVCRDGTISAAVAGALAQRTQRPIRFLRGGVIRYYDEILRPKGILSETSPSSLPSTAVAPGKRPETGSPAPGQTPTDPASHLQEGSAE